MSKYEAQDYHKELVCSRKGFINIHTPHIASIPILPLLIIEPYQLNLYI